MSSTKQPCRSRLVFHHQAYLFVKEALTSTQKTLLRKLAAEIDEDSAHITGRELLEGIRCLASRQFGMLAPTVFASWGVRSTHDFGRIVFELVDMGEVAALKTTNSAISTTAIPSTTRFCTIM